MSVADKAASWAIGIAEDDTHGYDQAKRWGVDYDCSSLVISAYQRAGVPLTCTFTGNMRSDMLAHGFQLVTDGTLKRGDVLLNERSHTAMYIGDGYIVQASSNESGGIIGGRSGDQTGKEICTRPYYNFPWDFVLRYAKDDAAVSLADSYTVRPGDTLIGISTKTGVSVEKILSLNSVKDRNIIYVGQILRLKGDDSVDETAFDSDIGESDDDVCKQVPTYEVKAGDTLWGICVKHLGSGTRETIEVLKEWNGLHSDTIYVGQRLKLGRD